MKKKMALFAMCIMCVNLIACGAQNDSTSTPKTTTSSATEAAQTSTSTTAAQDTTAAPEQETTEAETEADQSDLTEETTAQQSDSTSEAITEEQALAAIKNYCFAKNPDLKNKAESDEYTVYWDAATNNNNEIVVLYRSYTGAEVRYYVDPVSGETYATDLVPGIIDEEQRNDESLNVKDYLS